MEVSVYDLITKLTKKHIYKRKYSKLGVDLKAQVKKIRSKAFETLLKKQHISEYTNELNNSDAICHLLACQYRLKHELDQYEKAEALHILINKLEETNFLNDPLAHNVILFLLYLRDTKPQHEKLRTYDIFNKVTLKNKSLNKARALEYDVFPQETFILPKYSYSDEDRSLKSYSSKIFQLEPKLNLKLSNSNSKVSLRNSAKVSSYKMNFTFDLMSSTKMKYSKIFNADESVAEGSNVVLLPSVKNETSEDIWEVASKLPLSNHRTWESLGNWEPEKELPFACESGPKTLHSLQKIITASTSALLENECIEDNIISRIDFLKCLKFMLVGMTSDIFPTNHRDLFYLKNATTVEGISHEALQSYCKDLMFCGNSYRALSKLCSSSTYSSNEKHGYVFKELTEAIKRYLIFYRVATVSVPDTESLLEVHSHMHPLIPQINTFARICKVAQYEGGAVPQGAELLNYIYQEIINTVDNNIALVLYSVFYPCCQIYFSRFLQRWLFEGVLIDPYEEFIIKSDSNFNNARSRIYWSKAFSLRPNSVPEFLSDLKSDILKCGKTMNLLKLCNPDASLYTHIMSRPVPLISCCLTLDHSIKLNQEIEYYYIEMASLCGPRISLYHNLRDRYGYEDNIAFASLVEKKRALSFKEMELRKQQEAEERAKLKRKIFEEMQEQMRLASEDKKKAKEEELQRDLLVAKQCAQIEEMRSKLVKEETKAIINYYDHLIEVVDKRRQSFELRKQKLLDTSLDVLLEQTDNKNCDDKLDDSSSDDIFLSPKSTFSEFSFPQNVEPITHPEVVQKQLEDDINLNKSVDTAQSLDTINANIEMYNQMNENNLAAQRNRAKVLNLEFDLTISAEKLKPPIISSKKSTVNMTEAQRNKLRVLSSEFDIYYDTHSTQITDSKDTSVHLLEENNGNILSNKQPSILLTNENSDSTITTTTTNTTSNNLASPGHEDVMNLVHRKKALKLKTKQSELLTILEKPNVDTPMSIDSTPNTEYCASDLQTPSSSKLSLNTDINLDTASIIDSDILTAQSTSNITDEHGFKFPTNDNNKKFTYDNTDYKLLFAGKKKIFSITENVPKRVQPMRMSKEEVDAIKYGNLKYLLYQSVSVPLEAQMKLVNSEILKYFINEQNYFSHLHSLRSYYFIMDGEFGRSITEGLFTKLYESKNPADLLNLRSLQVVIEQALYASSKVQENGDRLSFIVKNIPKTFDLSNADVFDCLTLSYQINWPLNILLPYDTIEKYDLVFKYLLKLQYVSWILQKIFQDLKNSRKEYGIDENVLSDSPQFRRIQLCRHIMSHFIVTLQSYTVSEVLQTSWEELEENLKSVTTLDELYNVHILYLKTTIFRCLLNKKCAPIMKVIREIFVVILKFYNYLRSRSWNLKENDMYYTHPNFKKLQDIFNKFQEFTNFVFRVGNKMARVDYQPHLIQMLDMLNINHYYTSTLK